MKGKMFVFDVHNKSAEQNVKTFHRLFRVRIQSLGLIVGGYQIVLRGARIHDVSLVNYRQYYSYFGSFNNLKSKLHLILLYLFTNFTAKNLLFIFYSQHSEQTNIQKIKVPQL